MASAFTGPRQIDPARRAERAWARIQRWPQSIQFTKPRTISGTGSETGPTELAAQTVRVESDNRESLVGGQIFNAQAGIAPERGAIIYGIQDHPTLPDTDVEEGYTFFLEGDHYRISDVITTIPGEKQALAVIIG